MHIFIDLAEKIIIFLSGMIIVWLFLTAGFSTTVISDTELAYYLRDNMLLNILFLLLFTAAVLLLWKKWPIFRRIIERISRDERYAFMIRRLLLSVIFLIGFTFIFLAQRTPVADQYSCAATAGEILDRNYESFSAGGYLNKYPNQIGIIWIFSLIERLAGTENYLALQLLNVISLTLFYRALSKITDLFSSDWLAGTVVIFSGMMFIPAYFYTTFVYGTLIGLFFAANGFYCCLLFERDKKALQAVLMAVFLALSIVSKSNYLIFVTGILIYELITLLSSRKVRSVIAVCLIALVLLGTSRGVAGATAGLTGQTLADGVSKWSWVAMGLQQDGDDHSPGWYNGYNARTFEETDFDTEAETEKAKANVKESLTAFAAHPGDALKFFSEKNASQWNCPDFQGISINQGMNSSGKLSGLMSQMFSLRGVMLMLNTAGPLYELLVTGLLLELILERKAGNRHPEFIAFKVILIGGFVFHTFWEAKAQYTLPYIMLVIPVSICGWELCFKRLSVISAVSGSAPSAGSFSLWVKSWLIGLAAVIAVVQSGLFAPLNILFLRDSKDTIHTVKYATPLVLPEGQYELLAPASQGNMEIAADNNPVNGTEQLYIRPVPQNGESSECLITLTHSSEWDRQYLQLDADGMLLEVPDDHMDDGQIVQSGEQSNSPYERWRIYLCADGTCRIMMAEKALTFNEEGQYLYITEWKDMPQQHWILQAAK